MVLSPGPCNVCGELGWVLFVTALHNGEVFLACNSCKAASDAAAYVGYWRADGSQAVEEFAPDGVRAATEAEVESLGYDLARAQRLRDAEFDILIGL